MSNSKSKGRPLVIAAFLLVLAAVATWMVPSGTFQRETRDVGQQRRDVLVPNSYKPHDASPQSIHLFMAPVRGFDRNAATIAFILVVGGAFELLTLTGALDRAINRLVGVGHGRWQVILIVVMTTCSALGGAFGFCEEFIPLTLLFIRLSLSLGFDSLVGLGMSFVPAGVGFAAGASNPFAVQIPQQLAGLAPISALTFRLLLWVFSTVITIWWLLAYAKKLRRSPELSTTWQSDLERRSMPDSQGSSPGRMAAKDVIIILILAVTLILQFVGAILWKWQTQEQAGCFIAMGLVCASIAGKRSIEIASTFVDGAKGMMSTALVVALTSAIPVVLQDGFIYDTIMKYLGNIATSSVGITAVLLVYSALVSLNFIIPSATAKAALTIPLLAPVFDSLNISRQILLIAFQVGGGGFTTMIVPTSGVTMGTLELAGVTYSTWLRWILPLQLMLFILGAVSIWVATLWFG